MEETIDLQDIIRTLKKRVGMIISFVGVSMIIAAIISFYFITPIYQASTQLLVNQQKNDQEIQTSEIQTNLQLISTYSVIIKSPAILTKVIDQLDLNTTSTELSNQITVSNAQNSQVVDISVHDEQMFRAVDIANVTAEIFQQEIQLLMKVDNVNVLSPAVLPDNPSPVKPNKLLNIAIAAVIGLMLGVGLAFLLEYKDTTVKTEADIEEYLELPIIGLVSPIDDKEFEQPQTEVRKFRK